MMEYTDNQLVHKIAKMSSYISNQDLKNLEKLNNTLQKSNLNDELLIIVHDIYVEAETFNWKTAKANTLALLSECNHRLLDGYGIYKYKSQTEADSASTYYRDAKYLNRLSRNIE